MTSGGLAAVSSSFFAALFSALGRYDVVHIHAEGPSFFCWLPKLFGKRVVVTVHGLDWAREKWRESFASEFIRCGEKNAVKYLRREDKYDGRIYINGEKHRDDLVECVGVMKKEFGDWLANAGIFFNRTKVQVRCPDSCDGRFDTLEEAIALVYDGLEDPEKLL